ncbi:Malonyl CoA-acyl carrier protein transacylase [Enhygromyxa salina]|uniref:Malonyl CoA-acyl carrier protein transacylase n=1 Tax=Enhygromyxa salina TaxID=215803 RepID=A0A0C2CUH2_9BACT|nr:Malonyl CoA-acyl carrier protein transacylase [Enhygromyxa salina]
MIGARELDDLRALAKASGATLYMTLLAGFAALLGARVDGRELVIASPVANRPLAELEGVVGYFVNTVALRLSVEPERSFAALLRETQRVTAEAHSHKDLPFAELAPVLAPVLVPGAPPRAQLMFNLLPPPPPVAGAAALSVDTLCSQSGSARHELNLTVQAHAEGLEGQLEYSTELFGQATAGALVRGYARLLAAAVADPEASLATLQAASVDRGSSQ